MITQYCIYFNPSDFPNKYVLRKWFISEDLGKLMLGLNEPVPDDHQETADTLEEIRSFLPKDAGLVRIPYQPGLEDPCIWETWI